MKKKMIALLLCVSMIATMSGCGNDNSGESVKDTESGTEVASSGAIEYNASDYVTLGDYKGLNVTLTDDYEVDDSEVVDFVNTNVIANYPYYTDSDKTTVEDGDYVNLDYTGTKDGEEFDGGSATGYVLQIGSNSFIDGFEAGLVGANVGDELDLPLTFPETYDNNPDLAGAEVNFHVVVNKIVDNADITYDTLTDDYVAYLQTAAGMSYTTVDEMIEDIKTYLQSSDDSSKQSAIRSDVLTQLADVCTVNDYPEGLIDARLAEVIAQYESYYCSDGSELSAYVEENFDMTYDDFLEEIKNEVTSDVDTQLILETIAKEENVEFNQDDFDTYVSNLVSSQGLEDADALYETYGSDTASGEAYVKRVYLCNQALQVIVDSANVTVEIPTETETETPTEGTETATGTEVE